MTHLLKLKRSLSKTSTGPVELRMVSGCPASRQNTIPVSAVPRKLSNTPCTHGKTDTAFTHSRMEQKIHRRYETGQLYVVHDSIFTTLESICSTDFMSKIKTFQFCFLSEPRDMITVILPTQLEAFVLPVHMAQLQDRPVSLPAMTDVQTEPEAM